MKSALDMKHPKGTSVMVLLYKGEYAGRIIANWSDNPNGSVCTATVSIYDGPLNIKRYDEGLDTTWSHNTAKAGGYGYCKLSQAVGNAMGKGDEIGGRGISAVRDLFQENGYTFLEVL